MASLVWRSSSIRKKIIECRAGIDKHQGGVSVVVDIDDGP